MKLIASRALLLLALFSVFALPPAVAWSQPSAQAPVQPSIQAAVNRPVFVLNSKDANISVIDPITWTEIKRIPTGKEPHHLYLTPDEKSLVVANAAGDSLTFLDPKTAEVQRTVRGILDPYHLRFSPDMKWFVLAANRLNHIDIYRWSAGGLAGVQPVAQTTAQAPAPASEMALVKRIATGKTPSHLWIDSKSTTVYSTMQDSDELVQIDLATQAIKWRGKTGAMPADVFGTPDDKHLLIGLTGGEGVEVYDITGAAPKLIKTIKTGLGAHAFRAAGDKRHVYVSNRVANTISKIDYLSMAVVDVYAAPGGPDCMEVSADGKLIFVSSRWARKLTVIDTTTRKIVRQVNVGASPHGVWTLDHAGRQ